MAASTEDLGLAEALRSSIGSFVREARRHDVIPAAQAAVLGSLDRDGPQSIRSLADAQGVRHQTMAKMVGGLRDSGQLAITADRADQRRVVVTLTPSGRRLLNADRRQRAGWIANAMASLSAHDRLVLEQVPALLDVLVSQGSEGMGHSGGMTRTRS